jgi:hypothetical protein
MVVAHVLSWIGDMQMNGLCDVYPQVIYGKIDRYRALGFPIKGDAKDTSI